MTKNEINRRLAGLTPIQIILIMEFATEDFDPYEIRYFTGFSLKQINAVIAGSQMTANQRMGNLRGLER